MDHDVKVVVLRATGEVFCAGADLESLQKLQRYSYEENLEDSRHLKDLFLQIYRLKKVVIAQVQGHALAGGCGLASVCDFVFAAPQAKFGYTEVRIGFVPALVMVFLLRRISGQHVRQLLLSGESVQGDQAVDFGLVNFLVEKENLESAVLDFARKLIQGNSGQSMELTKRMLAEIPGMKLDEGLEYAAAMNAKARDSDDCKKGIKSFLEKTTLLW
jgi:methylglutaconyl-CoA hydratase